jgi:hypothetical protein
MAELNDIKKQYGRILYGRGKNQAYIAKQLNVSQQRISQLKKNEGWEEDRLPKFTRLELVENAEEILFRYQIDILTGEEEDSTRAALNQAKLASALKELEEINVATSARNRAESARIFMERAAKEGRPEVLEFLQAIYDEEVDL